jgi:hypothetical protein
VQARLDRNPDAMRTRRETVEHPFGTLKMRMGATRTSAQSVTKTLRCGPVGGPINGRKSVLE